jgi:AraC-like DNA-binding protein
MDALSEILRVVSLESAIYLNAELSDPWCLASPQSRELAPVVARGGAHVIIYHLLCEGRAYTRLTDGEDVVLSAGDIVTFPHGHQHLLGSSARAVPVDIGITLSEVLARGVDLLHLGGGGTACRFICGFFACDPRLSQTFLGGLPPLIKVNIRDDPSGQWLENSLKFSVDQSASREAGSGVMLTKLSELVFAETLRRYVRGLPEGETGWLAGARDAEVGKALTLLHHRHAHPWTLAELAKQAGVSRTVLVERFQHFLGEAPMTYLMRWRLRLAARSLTATQHSVAHIASETGYESEASFNRAFKREYGVPPAKYRREASTPSPSAGARGATRRTAPRTRRR